MKITDPEVRVLARLLRDIRSEYSSRDSSWDDSPFSWIRGGVSSRRKGAVAERLLAEYLTSKGFLVAPAPDQECDRLVNGVRAEIKMSTLWANGFYRFQQLRDQNYQMAVCLGISPFHAHCWAIPKSVIRDQQRRGGIPPQHGGSAGRDTAWLHVNPDAPPAWLRDWGGGLSEAVSVIARLVANVPLAES